MNTTYECIPCAINQGISVAKSLDISDKNKKALLQELLKFLSKLNFTHITPPELAKYVYDIVDNYIDVKDPFYEIKNYYNTKMLEIEDDLRKFVNKQDNFSDVVKFVISGNIIDFGAKHDLTEKEIFNTIDNIEHKKLAIDDSKKLRKSLKKAKTLFYIGDNCGEIVFDKIFIEYILKNYNLDKIYFGVRGGPIINDITEEDAKKVGIDKYAEILDTGVKAPGVILKNLKEDYQEKLFKADTVIAKGQGNFESLSEMDRENVFFLFMAKCSVIAEKLGVNVKSLLCSKK